MDEKRAHISVLALEGMDGDDQQAIDDRALEIVGRAARAAESRVKPRVKALGLALAFITAAGTVVAYVASVLALQDVVETNTEVSKKNNDRVGEVEKWQVRMEAEAKSRDIKIDDSIKVRDKMISEVVQVIREVTAKLDAVATEQTKQSTKIDTAIELLMKVKRDK